MADTGSGLVKQIHGKLGDAANKIGGTLVSTPLNLRDVEQHFGHDKQFSDTKKLLDLWRTGSHAT